MTEIATQVSLSSFGGDNLRVDTFLHLEESVYENRVQVGERFYVCYCERRVFCYFFLVCGEWCEWSFLHGIYFYNLTFDMNLYMEKLLNGKFVSYSRYVYNS